MWRLLSFTAFFATATWALAQSAPSGQLISEPFQENLRSEAPVSGGDILGVVVSGDRSNAEKLFLYRSTSGSDLVCVEITTRDGRYIASNTYRLPKSSTGVFVPIPVESQYPIGTKHPEYYRLAALDNFAVLAQVGACTNARGNVVPVAWGKSPTTITHLTVTVQSARTQAYLNVGEGANIQRVLCSPINKERATAFDTLCDIVLPAGAKSPIRLQLERCDFGECTRAPAVRLAYE